MSEEETNNVEATEGTVETGAPTPEATEAPEAPAETEPEVAPESPAEEEPEAGREAENKETV